jgi:hypothetical protein
MLEESWVRVYPANPRRILFMASGPFVPTQGRLNTDFFHFAEFSAK